MKSYDLIQDHVISWILIRSQRLNLSESTVNDKKSQKKAFFIFFVVSLHLFFEFLKMNFQKKSKFS